MAHESFSVLDQVFFICLQFVFIHGLAKTETNKWGLFEAYSIVSVL